MSSTLIDETNSFGQFNPVILTNKAQVGILNTIDESTTTVN